jgi:hypothetical protein
MSLSTGFAARNECRARGGCGRHARSRQIMLCILNGLTFRVGQPVEHPWRRLPAEFSVGSQVPHCITGLFELGQDLGDEGLLALGGRRLFSLLARDIYPEFQLFCHPQFHLLALVLAIESLGQISVLRIGRPRHRRLEPFRCSVVAHGQPRRTRVSG